MYYLIFLMFLVQALISTGTAALHKGFTLGLYTPQVISAPSPNVVSTHVVQLNRKIGSRSTNYLSAMRNNQQTNGLYKSGSSPLVGDFGDIQYDTEITFGEETFAVIVDTGSSDTWLAGTDFECVTIGREIPLPEFACEFGPTYNITEEFKQIPGENFNITYGDGEFVTGIIGFEDITLAGIKVNQQVGIVNYTAWEGDGVASGLVGLAYPSLTSAFQGEDPTQDSELKRLQYNPIFTTMIVDELIKPMFSLAIERGDLGGYLALGGLPPVPFAKNFTCAPIQVLTLKAYDILTQYSFYAITVDGFEYSDSGKINPSNGTWPNPMNQPTNATNIQVVVDSGTTLIYLPTDLANSINSKFGPPASYDPGSGTYTVDCDAKAPSFAVAIGGKNLWINPSDMIINNNGYCFTGISSSDAGPYVLGDVFFKNVIAVFDVGAAEMRFAPREFYSN